MTMSMRVSLVLAVASLVALEATVHAQVTFDRIVRGETETRDWLTYSGGLLGQRHSPLAQITPANVKTLELQ